MLVKRATINWDGESRWVIGCGWVVWIGGAGDSEDLRSGRSPVRDEEAIGWKGSI